MRGVFSDSDPISPLVSEERRTHSLKVLLFPFGTFTAGHGH